MEVALASPVSVAPWGCYWRFSRIESLANLQTGSEREQLHKAGEPLNVGQHACLDEVFVAGKILLRSGEAAPSRARHHLPVQKKSCQTVFAKIINLNNTSRASEIPA